MTDIYTWTRNSGLTVQSLVHGLIAGTKIPRNAHSTIRHLPGEATDHAQPIWQPLRRRQPGRAKVQHQPDSLQSALGPSPE